MPVLFLWRLGLLRAKGSLKVRRFVLASQKLVNSLSGCLLLIGRSIPLRNHRRMVAGAFLRAGFGINGYAAQVVAQGRAN